MTRLCCYWLLAALSFGCSRAPGPARSAAPPAVLVFFKTSGFHHASIAAGVKAWQQLGHDHGLRVDTTVRAAYFAADTLRRYQAVVFLNTTGDVLDAGQQAALEQYIGQGHGFMGVHAATDTEPDWPWYQGLVGAHFDNHPAVQTATILVTDHRHAATRFLPARWVRTDEWYNFRNLAPDLRVLATLDETSYTGGKHGPNHPIAWYHSYGGGRAFYTACGHTDQSYTDPLFLRHLLGGLHYVLGPQRPKIK